MFAEEFEKIAKKMPMGKAVNKAFLGAKKAVIGKAKEVGSHVSKHRTAYAAGAAGAGAGAAGYAAGKHSK
jgi:hypothetical protein